MSWLPPRRRVQHPAPIAPPAPKQPAPPAPPRKHWEPERPNLALPADAPSSYRPTGEQPIVAWVAPRCPFCRSRDSKHLGRYAEKRLRYLSCRKCGGRYKAIEVGEDTELGALEETARELAAGIADHPEAS